MGQNYFIFILFFLLAIAILFVLTSRKVILITARIQKLLLNCIFIYITLPAMLFLISLPINIPLKTITSMVILYYGIKAAFVIRGDNIIEKDAEYRIRLNYLITIWGLLILSYASLFFGYGFLGDWPKHRSVLLSIFFNPIEPRMKGFNINDFDIKAQASIFNTHLTYYYAMYLPSVYIVKLVANFLSIKSVRALTLSLSYVFFFWNLLGLIMVTLLLPLFSQKLFGIKRKKPWGGVFIWLIVFTGFNYWFRVFTEKGFKVGHVEWTTPYYAQYYSFLSFWQWVPSQLIAGLIGVMFLGIYKHNFKKFPLCLCSTFILVSSVFCWLGMLPLIIYVFYDWLSKTSDTGLSKKIVVYLQEMKIQIAATLFIAIIVLLFYMSKTYSDNLSLNKTFTLTQNGFVRYLYFLLIEFAALIIILFLASFNKLSIPKIIWVSVAFLVILPLIQLGIYNDLVSRSSIPALLIVMIYCALVIEQTTYKGSITAKFLIFIFLVIVIPHFISEYINGLKYTSNLLEKNKPGIEQYLGSGDIWQTIKMIWQ